MDYPPARPPTMMSLLRRVMVVGLVSVVLVSFMVAVSLTLGGKLLPSTGSATTMGARTPVPAVPATAAIRGGGAHPVVPTTVAPLESALPLPELETPPVPSVEAVVPARQPDYSKTYRAMIPGKWFWSHHHWANGRFDCPSGCHIHWSHHEPLETTDAFMFHGAPEDMKSSASVRELLNRPEFAGKLRLLYAAENFFPMMSNPADLARFNGEASYRQRSVAREVQYPLEAVARLTQLASVTRSPNGGEPDWMAATWDDLAPPAVPTAERRAADASTITWASTYCHSPSHREAYVEALMAAIPVEVYSAPCLANAPEEHTRLGRKEQWDLWRSYKFYLAFENTRCEDYVTEKFFLALVRGQVPIVLGAPNIADHAPSRDSYIDVRDYATPADLAAHLLRLDADPAAYDALLAWRKRPLATYGRALRSVLADALPVAYRDGAVAGHASGTMFACALCHRLADWDAAGRPLNDVIPPFLCEPPIAADNVTGVWQ